MTEENLVAAKREGLLKKFKLTTSISTTNMHLFDSKGAIKKYDTPEQILEDFFHLRLYFYVKRKIAMLANLGNDLLKCSNKVRFIQCVIDGSIVVINRKRADLFVELKEKGFTPFPEKKSTVDVAVAGSTDDTNENDENAEVATTQAVYVGDYDYFLSLSIGTLTIEKMQELLAERDELDQEVKDLQNSTIESLWFKDLDALEVKLNEQEESDEIKLNKDMQAILKKAKDARIEVKNPRKNSKNDANKKESAPEPMEISGDTADNVGEVKNPKARAPAKTKATVKKASEDVDGDTAVGADNAGEVEKPKARAPAKKKAPVQKATEDENDDGIAELRDCIAAYNFDSSPDRSEAKRAPAKKKAQATITDISDDDIEILSDNDFEPEKKKGGRKPANAAKQPPGAKERGAAATKLPQKLITEMLQPAANSPEKKVRKLRESPFNKKSSSVLGKATINVDDDDEQAAESLDKIGNSSSSVESVSEVAPRTRPVRARAIKKYFVSDDSESDAVEDDSSYESSDDSESDHDADDSSSD